MSQEPVGQPSDDAVAPPEDAEGPADEPGPPPALMLQLTSSAGIYPAETLPGPLRALHPYLPMTYLVDAFRVVFTGGSTAHLARDAVVLAAVGVVAFAGTCLVMARRRTWTMATVHPQLGG